MATLRACLASEAAGSCLWVVGHLVAETKLQEERRGAAVPGNGTKLPSLRAFVGISPSLAKAAKAAKAFISALASSRVQRGVQEHKACPFAPRELFIEARTRPSVRAYHIIALGSICMYSTWAHEASNGVVALRHCAAG